MQAGLNSGYAHNDPQSVESTIRDWRVKGGVGRVWIVVESIYSMDGDFAPLKDLVAIADRYDAFLMVDEAHATGVYGEQGRGLTAPYEKCENVLVVHTCGKALGAAGAIVTAARVLRDFLVNRCRPFIFATAPSPLMAVAVREALLILQQGPSGSNVWPSSSPSLIRRSAPPNFGVLRARRSSPTSLATMRMRCSSPLPASARL